MSIIIKTSIKASPGIVFKAVTTTKGYRGWWAKQCDIDCRASRLSSVRFVKEHITEEMVFITEELIPDQRLLWRCTANNVFESMIGNTLLFEISAKGAGAVLIFTQSSTDPHWHDHPEYEDILAGWTFFLQSLKAYCETGKGQPWG